MIREDGRERLEETWCILGRLESTCGLKLAETCDDFGGEDVSGSMVGASEGSISKKPGVSMLIHVLTSLLGRMKELRSGKKASGLLIFMWEDCGGEEVKKSSPNILAKSTSALFGEDNRKEVSIAEKCGMLKLFNPCMKVME